MSFLVRALTPDDAAACAELEKQLFADDSPWSRDVFLVEFSHPNTFYLGVFAEQDPDQLVGYGGIAMLGPVSDPEFEVHTIGVDPAQQRQGIGRELMDQLTHAADTYDGQMFLEVRTDNDAAIKLYESFDFVSLGVRKGYYQPSGADALTMSRSSRSER